MSFKSLSTAKVLLAVLVAIGSTSLYFAKQWQKEVVVAREAVSKAQSASREGERAYKELAASLAADVSSQSLQDAMSGVVLDIFNQRVEHGVTVGSAIPSKLNSAGTVSPLDAISEPVPGTSVQSVRVNLKGAYTDYQGLLSYIRTLQKHPVSVVHFRVQDQGFELGLRIYGEMGNNS